MAQAKKMSKDEANQELKESKQESRKSDKEKWNDDWVETEGFWSASPPRTKRSSEEGIHVPSDHCATTTTILTTTTTTTTITTH